MNDAPFLEERSTENHTDFQNSRNVIVAALIIGLAIGSGYSNAGAIAFSIGSVNISL